MGEPIYPEILYDEDGKAIEHIADNYTTSKNTMYNIHGAEIPYAEYFCDDCVVGH